MEETKVICEESTENSLVLIDELGKFKKILKLMYT